MVRLFIFGLFMGSADIIPGVSGGTIALVVGIYKELISSLKSLRPKILLYLVKLDFSSFRSGVRRIKFGFLLPLLAGIAVAIWVGSKVIDTLLNFYPGPTYSFFSGLIFASAIFIFVGNKRTRLKSYIPLIVGFLGGFYFVGVQGVGLHHQLWIIFLSGAVAVCAMILPGVSGAFLLLLLGQYEFMLEALHKALSNVPVLFVFVLGAGFGLVAFTRVVSFFIDNYEKDTMGFLVGLMTGSLRRPINIIIKNTSEGGLASMKHIPTIIILAISGVAGMVIVYFLKGSTSQSGMSDLDRGG